MSAATEIAEREAAEAEAENPDSEEAAEAADAEPQPEPETEPEPEPSSLAVIEDYERKVKSEFTRHENALAKLHPDDWETFLMCPCCMGEGFMQPIPPGEQPDEVWEVVKGISGRQVTGELKHAPYAETCDMCAGYGSVDVGALNTANASLPCRQCAGYGWLDIGPWPLGISPGPNAKKVAPPPVQLAAVPNQAAAPATPWPDYDVPFIPLPGGAADPYHRPAGHPRWGMNQTADGRNL